MQTVAETPYHLFVFICLFGGTLGLMHSFSGFQQFLVKKYDFCERYDSTLTQTTNYLILSQLYMNMLAFYVIFFTL